MASNLTLYRNGNTPFDLFESFFRDPFNDDFFMEPVSRLSRRIVSSDFPSANIYAEKNGTYCAELGLAGYTRDEINVETKDDVVIVKLGHEKSCKCEDEDTETCTCEKEDERRYFQKGLKHPSYVEWRWDVSSFKLDVSTAKVEFKDGVLKISMQQLEAAKPRVLAIE